MKLVYMTDLKSVAVRHPGSSPGSRTKICQLNCWLRRYMYMYLKEDIMSYNDIVMQVRELLGRNLDSSEISHRLHIDIRSVESIIQKLKLVS